MNEMLSLRLSPLSTEKEDRVSVDSFTCLDEDGPEELSEPEEDRAMVNVIAGDFIIEDDHFAVSYTISSSKAFRSQAAALLREVFNGLSESSLFFDSP